MLWQIDIDPAEGQPDLEGQRVAHDAADLGITTSLEVRTSRGYLLQGDLKETDVKRLADELFADRVCCTTRSAKRSSARRLTSVSFMSPCNR